MYKILTAVHLQTNLVPLAGVRWGHKSWCFVFFISIFVVFFLIQQSLNLFGATFKLVYPWFFFWLIDY